MYGVMTEGHVPEVAEAMISQMAWYDAYLGVVVPELTSFGVDGTGRMYALSLTGDVFRIDPKS